MAGFADVEAEPHVVFGIHDSPPRPSKSVAVGCHDTRCWHPRYDETSTVLGRAPISSQRASWIPGGNTPPDHERSEEHTSELQSRFDRVCRLLLEKKKLE